MAIDLGNDFAPTWPGRPPGMSPQDHTLWQRWRPKQVRRYEKYNFNVRLIQEHLLPPDTPPSMVKMWLDNNARRIDVLAWAPKTIDIVELRITSGLSAIGQLIGYYRFLLTEPPDTRPIQMILVTDFTDPSVHNAADFVGISVELT